MDIKPDFRVIALDLGNGQEFIAEGDRPYLSAVMGVYFYDKNEHTHLCEARPSHCLYHLYERMDMTEAGQSLDAYEQDRLSNAYEFSEVEPVIYMHVSTLDALETKLRAEEWRYREYGEISRQFSDLEYRALVEAVREDLCGNHLL